MDDKPKKAPRKTPLKRAIKKIVKKNRGRPTKYKPEYCDQIIDFMAEGKSLLQFACSIGVHTDTIQEWKNVYPDFSVAIKKGQEESQAFWEGELKEMMGGRKCNPALVKLYFANRFGWSDRTETRTDITSSDGSLKLPSKIELSAPEEN